ncbi:MAG TPA: DUF1858 domain-containing protein [Gemmataceae bacterium]|nr:DUF1858 domain-containing protein [Gemmataceae bacterium]
MKATGEWIDGQVLIPDLLRAVPQARPVLDRYGLRGCGGELGPVESLGFFAHAHDVPLPGLLRELREVCERPAELPPTPPVAQIGDAIYRPFFKAGIVLVLTLGAVWGAYLLLRIAFSGEGFKAVGLHEVNAHGHAQIFGWVGLFVMGFAYQAFPRFKHTTLSHPRLALATLGLMLTGVVGRSVCEPLAVAWPGLATPAVAASALEVAAIALFVGIILATWRASGKPLAFYDWYVLSAFVWFLAQAVYEAAYLAATFAAGPGELVPLVARWQGALREMQIHGFALLIILGVSQRLFAHFYGFAAPSRRLSLVGLACLNAAVVGEVVGLIFLRDGPGWVALWYGSVLLLAGTIVVLVRDWHIFRTPPESDRGLKFLRAAYVWLFASLAMLVLMPVYQHALLPWLAADGAATQLGFSHAYYGAVRHAITVGFVSLMIVGVASKVVPTLNGVDVRRLSPLWGPFLLINAGCTMRVVAQTLTDVTASSFPFAGLSGVLEVMGLALWGAHLWAVMAGRARVRAAAPAAPVVAGEPIAAAHRVGEVLDRYPELLNTFVTFGFTPLTNPLLRKTVARLVTIERACRAQQVDVDELLTALNIARARLDGQRLSLNVLSAGAPSPTEEPEEGPGCPHGAGRMH